MQDAIERESGAIAKMSMDPKLFSPIWIAASKRWRASQNKTAPSI